MLSEPPSTLWASNRRLVCPFLFFHFNKAGCFFDSFFVTSLQWLCQCAVMTSPPQRPHGERSSSVKCATEADTASADGPAFSCTPFGSARRLPGHPPTDPVSWTTGSACSHDALPCQAEPHNSHPETLWPGPSGDTAGAGVSVRTRLCY